MEDSETAGLAAGPTDGGLGLDQNGEGAVGTTGLGLGRATVTHNKDEVLDAEEAVGMQHSLLDLVCDRGYRLLDLDLTR